MGIWNWILHQTNNVTNNNNDDSILIMNWIYYIPTQLITILINIFSLLFIFKCKYLYYLNMFNVFN